MIKTLIAGIVIGVIFIAPFIADPSSALAIGKIVAEKVVSVGVPLVKEIISETTPVVTDAIKEAI